MFCKTSNETGILQSNLGLYNLCIKNNQIFKTHLWHRDNLKPTQDSRQFVSRYKWCSLDPHWLLKDIQGKYTKVKTVLYYIKGLLELGIN